MLGQYFLHSLLPTERYHVVRTVPGTHDMYRGEGGVLYIFPRCKGLEASIIIPREMGLSTGFCVVINTDLPFASIVMVRWISNCSRRAGFHRGSLGSQPFTGQ